MVSTVKYELDPVTLMHFSRLKGKHGWWYPMVKELSCLHKGSSGNL